MVLKDLFEKKCKVLEKTENSITFRVERFGNTPTPEQLADIANGKAFQSPSCLLGCKRPEKFVSVSWDKKENSCRNTLQ